MWVIEENIKCLHLLLYYIFYIIQYFYNIIYGYSFRCLQYPKFTGKFKHKRLFQIYILKIYLFFILK